MNRKYNIQLNLSPYANVYEEGGLVGRPNGVQLIPIETKGISPSDAVNPNAGNAEGGNKFMDFMNSSGGGGWASAIAPAATNAINALTDTEASTAERVATAMGIPALAKIWTADTTAGDANLKAMQSNIDTFARQNLIQDASSTFGANNAVKLNNKFIAPVPMTDVKDLSWKDFRGNMFKKGAAATLQGAAAGSVGGPWGALGGAVTGLFGSLFGGIGARSRAKKAYAEYQNKMATLTSQANSMYKQALTNQTLSNMQALANGNMSQRINDMANIRAYGGNLYLDGGGIDPYYPESQDPTAVNWLSDWYRQRPEQMQNTFKPTRYNDYSFTLPKPNISGEYESIEDIPSNRSVGWETRKYNDINEYNNALYHNLIDRAASPSILYRMDLPSDIKGVYSASGLYEKENSLPPEDINKSTKIIEFIDNFKATHNNQSPKSEDYEAAGLNPLDLAGMFTTQIETGRLPKVANTISYNMREVPAYANPDEDYYDAETLSNRIHETNHAIQNDNRGISRSLRNIVNMNKQTAEGVVPNSYLDSPEEIHSRMMQLRYETGLKPTDVITQDFINNNKDKIKALNLDRYTDQSLINLLNNVVDNNNVNSYNNIAAMGGNLYTDLSPNMINLWNSKQQIDQQKAMNQQFSLGLGNTAFANQFAGGGQMTSADVPDNMQYYANGGTHEENPYGGIQVGTDQQGTPNLAEEGEFRWNDFVFSDRINVDANLLSSFNLAPTTKHQNKKAAKGKLSYADMAKKYAKRNKELENDPITKNSMEAFMQRLANAQEYQKKADQLEAQKQNELQDYKTALNKQNNNPMYGTMKYNGMGNAATQQGVNSGVDAGMGNPMSNADLSNVNRSGNEMMAAYGGNLFAIGGDNGFPESLLSEAYKRYRESQYPTIKDNEVTLKAKPQDFTPWVSEPDTYPVDYEYFFDNNSPTKFTGMSPTGVQPYIHPGASPIDTYQYTPYKSRIGSNLPVYAPHSNYVYESNGSRIPFYLRYEPQYFKHSNRIEDNYIPIEQPWEGNVVIPDRGIQGNRNWTKDDYTATVYKQNFNSKLDTRPSRIRENNPNSNAPAVSTYTDEYFSTPLGSIPRFEENFGKVRNTTLYPKSLKAFNNNEYLSQLERNNPTKLIVPNGTGWGIPQNNNNEGLNLGIGTSQQPTDISNADAQYTYKTGDEGITGRQGLTGSIDVSNKVIDKTTSNTNPDAAVPSDPKEIPLYSTAGKYAQFGKGIMPMVWDWANRTNVAYDPYQRDADRLEALANEGPALRTADTIGGYRAPNLMDVERLNNSARSEGLAQMQAILDAANGNRGYVGAHSAQNNYNTQMGIGDNYVKTHEANNTNRLQTDQFNHGINVANQNAINAMYQDNQRAEQTQHQAALSGTAQAAALRQRENLHADEVNTERMKNRATNQAAAVDNALNYFTTQAMENQELNTRNNDPTNPYWIDKYGRTHYTGDSGLTQAIRDAFGNDEYGRNGTFTGDRLTEWNNLTKKYKAKDLKEHPELWQHLVTQQREANKIDAEKAEQARTEELEALRGTYQSNLARLNALRDSGAIISDPSYNLYTGWADDDYSGNQGLLRTRNQALDQYITQIGNNYDRYLYEKQLAQNQAKALGGYLNAGQNNNNDYYSYTRI